MEENNKKKFSGAQVAFMIFVAIVITAAAAIAVFVFITKTNTNQTSTLETTKTSTTATNTVTSLNTSTENTITSLNVTSQENTIKNETATTIPTTSSSLNDAFIKYCVLAKIEATNTGYDIYAYELEEDYRTVKTEQIAKLENGGTIHFRGRDFAIANTQDNYIFLRDIKTNEQVALYKNTDDSYTFGNVAGKKATLKDYKSETPVVYHAPKNFKVADSFDTVNFNFYTNDVYVTPNELHRDLEDEKEQNEANTKYWVENKFKFNPLSTTGGDTFLYFIDGEVKGIEQILSSGP